MIFKERICKYCKAKYQPEKSKQIVCGAECAIAYSEKQRTKQLHTQARMERKAMREKKQTLKTRSDWIKEVQIVVNKYIRLRDFDKPCISCKRFHTGQYHAGHFRSVGSAPHLRFDERNIFKQCSPCNNHLSGNLILYRANLVDIYGSDYVQALESDNTPRHYTIDELKALKAHYQAKIRDMEK